MHAIVLIVLSFDPRSKPIGDLRCWCATSIPWQNCMSSDVALQSESGDLSKSMRFGDLLFSVCHAEIAKTVGTSFPSVAEKPPIPVVRDVIEH